MRLSEFCIKRPVFTLAITLVLIIMGAISFQRLGVRLLPDISRPNVVVVTQYMGASPEIIENDITTPLENALAGVNGIDYIQSSSIQNTSQISVYFKVGYDLNVAIDDVRDKVFANINELPQGTITPVIYKASIQQSDPAAILALTDAKQTPMQITDYANRVIIPELEQIAGVNNIETWGSRDYAMRIWLSPAAMAARNVAINDVTHALQTQNVNMPAGEVRNDMTQYAVMSKSQFSSVDDFKNITLKGNDNFITKLTNIANIEVAAETIDSAFRIHGKPAVALAVIPTSVANPIDVTKGVEKSIHTIQENLPSGMNLSILFNVSDFIKFSIQEVYHSLFEALLLVTVVIFLFLGNVRSTLIPLVTIPVCLISVFSLLYLFGYTINTMTLLALVLAIGLVVDDAIVILENIHRNIEQGLSPFQAAKKGSREIAFAIIAMTLTLVAVYLPITVTQGITGILFQQFAVTLAGAVLISGFVALSLSPMMSARMLVARQQENRYERWLEKCLHKMRAGYKTFLVYILSHRIYIIIILLLLTAAGYISFKTMPTELAPIEDHGYIQGMIQGPTDASFPYMLKYAQEIEHIYATTPGIQDYFMGVGGTWGTMNSAFSIARLLPWNKRNLSQQQISEILRKKMNAIPGVMAFPVLPSPLGQNNSSDHAIEFNILSSVNYPQLHALGDHIVDILKSYPGLTMVRNNLQIDSQQYDIKVNYNLAADLGVDVGDISKALASLLGQNQTTQFDYDGRSYDVLLQLPLAERRDLSILKTIYIRSATTKQMIPLSSIVSIDPYVGSLSLSHYNRMRVDTITAEIKPGYKLGDVVQYLQHVGQTLLPSNASYAFTGSLQDFLTERSRMLGVFLLALAIIYLVLAAQFESLVDPLIVLLAVPLSLVGGLFTLKLVGGTINVFSEIALVTLVGLIAKHGILIVEFANQLREQGKARLEAVIEAASLRLRPILMTTGAMVLGALPLALAVGPGSNTRQQIGWVIVGGMLIGTFFSLLVVPVAYSFLSSRHSPNLQEE